MLKSLALATAGLALVMTTAAAEEFPSKTIEVVTHAGAGGGTDVNSRMMMLRARRELGTDMVVVNKRGGPSGALAMQYFQTRPADGYTIMTWTNGHALTMAMGKSDLKLEDMRPLARGTNDPQVLMVNCKTSPYKTSDEFMAGAKSTKMKYGTTNIGGLDHITAYMFAKRVGGPQPDIVPFKGGGELATQLVAGSIDVGVLNLSEASAQIEAGDICPMVVLDEERMAPIPDVKTAKEMGANVVFATVRGFVTHAGVPDDRAAKLEGGMIKAMDHSMYQAYLQSSGLEKTSVLGAEAWGKQMKQLMEDLVPAAKEMGLVK
ncbi:MAG: tripartite tricarboxylate transporter substrate binding protein [Alphaproteobacteria bacterium]